MRVIIAIPRSLLADAEPIAYACEEEGIKLRFMADVFSLHVARVRLTQAGDLPLLNLEPVAQDEGALLFKRCFDLTVTLLSMPVVLPIMGIVALAIKLDSPGPVLFIQQRVGLKKRLFPMMKFRSMCDRAEDKLCEIEHLNQAEGPIFKITDDPRITRVGRFIRKTSLDELPQLFNVIRGEMSLVGPRPMSIRDVDLFDKGHPAQALFGQAGADLHLADLRAQQPALREVARTGPSIHRILGPVAGFQDFVQDDSGGAVSEGSVVRKDNFEL
jgi:lipopolysaccharide/colanic/teichoic acid biosynthesis glycosyltransferase